MFKKAGLWAICLLAILSPARAQQGSGIPDSAEVTERYRFIDTTLWYDNQYVFAGLNTDRIASGILLDYGIGFADPAYFDGRRMDDSNYCNFRLLEQLNSTLYSSIISEKGAGVLPRPQELFDRSHAYAGSGTLALAGLLLDYQAFSTDTGKLDTAKGQLYERYAAGSGPGPYDTRTVFAMSLPYERSAESSLHVLLPQELWFSNKQGSVRELSLDAGDGLGWRPLIPGVAFDIDYPEDGLKEWRFIVRLADGSVLMGHSALLLETAKTTGSEWLDAFNVYAREPYMDGRAIAKVRIQYADPYDRVLRRPLVLVEGFDPGKYLAPGMPYGFSDLFNDFHNDYDYIDKTNQLYKEVQNGKYDLVYVDWEDGTDYLQRNALALETVLEELNRRKKPLAGVRQQNVVWGFSMGGVICRYALKDMENKGLSHETRLFISQDAPHLGAHIPQGYLEMVDHLNDLWFKTGKVKDMAGSSGTVPMTGSVSVNDLFKLPYRPAAAQMLYGHVGRSYKDWQAELQRKGYPAGCRNIAISNGSECGNSQPFAPAALQMGFHGQIRLELLANLALNNILGAVGLKIAAGALAPPIVLGMLPGGARWDMNFAVTGDADMAEQQLYFGEISYTKTVGYLVPITKSLSKAKFSRKGSYAWEIFGGGYFAAPLEGLGILKGGIYPLFNYSGSLEGQNRFSFIPTASALDIGHGAVSLDKTRYTARYAGLQPPTAPYNTPFDAFVAEYDNVELRKNNTSHIKINNRNADWLGHQLGGTAPVNCICPCIAQSQIAGPANVCNGAAETYTVSPTSSPVTVNWSLSTTPPGIATLLPAGNSCSVKVPAGVFGQGVLEARLSNACAGSPAYSRSINLGKPPVLGTFNITFAVDPVGGYKAVVSPYYADMTYRWAEQYYAYSAGGGTYKYTTPYAAGTDVYKVKYATSTDFARSTEYVYVEVSNGCGAMTFSRLKPDPGPFWRIAPDEPAAMSQDGGMQVYPNPAPQSWHIDLSQVQSPARRLLLYDVAGRLVQDLALNPDGTQVTVDNSGLQPGMYLLRIQLDNGVLHARLLKD